MRTGKELELDEKQLAVCKKLGFKNPWAVWIIRGYYVVELDITKVKMVRIEEINSRILLSEILTNRN